MKFSIPYRVISSLYISVLSARYALPVGIAFLVLLSFSSVASALLSGDASLTYTNYNGSARDLSAPDHHRVSMSSNSLVQNYSLLYSSNGPIYNSRVGHYDVSLGYNWTALDTTFKSSTLPPENYNETRGHLLYKGEITLDPKEVPLRLNLYSRDLTRNTISYSSGHNIESFQSVFGLRDQATNINDGIHIESGATLVAGVKNGMTNGYNELLRHLPMILIDYKDTINKDLLSMNPVNDRLSRLAFVSLNKKDNWFHYRHTLYDDYINSKNNYIENEIQLGTVDQTMSRHWIDFSNWLKVSTDLQLSRRKSNYQDHPIEEINLNLFVTGERKYWNARSYTTFNRYKDEYNKLSYQTTLPLYASGVVNQDLSWNARTTFRDIHDIDKFGTSTRFISKLAGYRVDAYKRAPFTLSQNFDVEATETNLTDFLTLSGALETSSTSAFSRLVTLGASYSIKNTTTSNKAAPDSNFIEHRLDMRGSYAPTNTLRFELLQKNNFTNGNFTPVSGQTRDSSTQLGQYINPRGMLGSNYGGSESYQSVSTLKMIWNPKPRLNIYLALIEDIYKSEALGVSPVTEVQTGVSFTNDAWNVSDTFKFVHGSRETIDDNANSISNSASLRYTHSRSLDGSVTASYSANYSKACFAGDIELQNMCVRASDSTTYPKTETYFDTSVEQRVNYYYYTRSGVARKLFEVNESLLYTDGPNNLGSVFTKSLMLGVKYYPISQLTLSSGVGYSFTNRFMINTPFKNDYTLVWNASVAANFRLLQVSLDYVHGLRKSDDPRKVSDYAIEERFTGNIRKSF